MRCVDIIERGRGYFFFCVRFRREMGLLLTKEFFVTAGYLLL